MTIDPRKDLLSQYAALGWLLEDAAARGLWLKDARRVCAELEQVSAPGERDRARRLRRAFERSAELITRATEYA